MLFFGLRTKKQTLENTEQAHLFEEGVKQPPCEIRLDDWQSLHVHCWGFINLITTQSFGSDGLRESPILTHFVCSITWSLPGDWCRYLT